MVDSYQGDCCFDDFILSVSGPRDRIGDSSKDLAKWGTASSCVRKIHDDDLLRAVCNGNRDIYDVVYSLSWENRVSWLWSAHVNSLFVWRELKS